MQLENTSKPTERKRHAPHVQQPLSAAENPDALLQARTVQALVGIGKSTLFTMVRDGRFPQPVRRGPRWTRWRAGNVTAWLKAQGA